MTGFLLSYATVVRGVSGRRWVTYSHIPFCAEIQKCSIYFSTTFFVTSERMQGNASTSISQLPVMLLTLDCRARSSVDITSLKSRPYCTFYPGQIFPISCSTPLQGYLESKLVCIRSYVVWGPHAFWSCFQRGQEVWTCTLSLPCKCLACFHLQIMFTVI